MRNAFLPHLLDPSPESWVAICKLLEPHPAPDQIAQLLADVQGLEAELRAWPPEIDRPPAKGWDPSLPQWRLVRRVREVDLYPLFIKAAATAPALRLSDGTPAVRLQRNFSGALQGAGGKTHRMGVEGQGDLSGSLCVEWRGCRFPIALEVEVKTASGKLRPAQQTRSEALHRRGEIYLTVRRTDEMIKMLTAERDRIVNLLETSSPSW